MFNIREVYYHLLQRTRDTEKFKMNVSEYKGRRVALFDYALTVPNDFADSEYTLESRGSLFEIDENDDFVSVLCLPYPKFFNLHEYDWGASNSLCDVFNDRYGFIPNDALVNNFETIHEAKPYFLEKLDGSIISFFELDGELDCKSNSSLISDYKYEALKIIDLDPEFREIVLGQCQQGWTVMAEYTSANPSRQIVIPYTETKLTVTGARHKLTGEFKSHTDLIELFGEDHVVAKIDGVSLTDYEESDIEGYILVVEEFGLRLKLKTEWYIDRHRIATDMSNKQIWCIYLDEKLDDFSAFVPTPRKDYYEFLINEFDNIVSGIKTQGREFFEKNKHRETKDFFGIINQEKRTASPQRHLALLYATRLFTSDVDTANRELIRKLKINKTISSLRISYIGNDFYG